MNPEELENYCQLIYKLSGKESIEGEVISNSIVSDYYSKSAFFYKKFHSKEGAMHLPISFSDKDSHASKLLYQANSIHDIIHANGYTKVLELGCGMGFNSNYLARKNPAVNFTGVDLTLNNIKEANKNAKELNNVNFKQMDFDALTELEEQYDLVFAVETLCHSKDVAQVIAHINEKLTATGKIIIYDGYVRPNTIPLSNKWEERSYKLLSWGFAMKEFQDLGRLQSSQKIQHLNIEEIKDYSVNVLPNYQAFQRGAIKAFRYPRLLKLMLKTRLISMALIKQMSAGLFGPYLINKGYLGYYKIVLSKKTS